MQEQKPWYDDTKYAPFGSWWNLQNECIAPTLKPGNPRCTRKLDFKARGTAASFLRTAESLPLGSQRDNAIQHLILALCCTGSVHSHHEKVKSSGGVYTLQKLVRSYGQQLNYVPINSCMPQQASAPIPAPPSLPVERFKTYFPDREETVTVEQEIEVDVDLRFVDYGSVYCVSWSESSTMVKIGFTARRIASIRVGELAKCLPGVRLEDSYTFVYPEKIERLIHRELRAQRRYQPYCEAVGCQATHTEFFETSVQNAVKVIRDWHHLLQMQPLYNIGRRNLRPYWRWLISRVQGDFTAYKLQCAVSDWNSNPTAALVQMRPPVRVDADALSQMMGTLQVRSNTRNQTMATRPPQTAYTRTEESSYRSNVVYRPEQVASSIIAGPSAYRYTSASTDSASVVPLQQDRTFTSPAHSLSRDLPPHLPHEYHHTPQNLLYSHPTTYSLDRQQPASISQLPVPPTYIQPTQPHSQARPSYYQPPTRSLYASSTWQPPQPQPQSSPSPTRQYYGSHSILNQNYSQRYYPSTSTPSLPQSPARSNSPPAEQYYEFDPGSRPSTPSSLQSPGRSISPPVGRYYGSYSPPNQNSSQRHYSRLSTPSLPQSPGRSISPPVERYYGSCSDSD